MEINLEAREYGKDLSVSFYDVDYKKRLKLSSMLRIFAILAGDDYTDRGMSHIFLREHGFAFLVSAVALKVYKTPLLEDEVYASTWVEGVSGAKFIRGYEMKDADGETMIIGQGVWILVNPETKKIVRPYDFPWQCKTVDKHGPVKGRAIKVHGAQLYGEYGVHYSDVDYNGHLNNTVYGDVITDSLPMSDLEREIDTFSLYYSHEARMGESIQLYRQDISRDACLISGKIGDVNCFDCEMVFKGNQKR